MTRWSTRSAWPTAWSAERERAGGGGGGGPQRARWRRSSSTTTSPTSRIRARPFWTRRCRSSMPIPASRIRIEGNCDRPWLGRVQPRARPASRRGGEALSHRSRDRRRADRHHQLRRRASGGGRRRRRRYAQNRRDEFAIARGRRQLEGRGPVMRMAIVARLATRWRLVLPFALVATGGCFATREDVRVLQDDLTRMQAAQRSEDSAHRAALELSSSNSAARRIPSGRRADGPRSGRVTSARTSIRLGSSSFRSRS